MAMSAEAKQMSDAAMKAALRRLIDTMPPGSVRAELEELHATMFP